MDVETYGQSTPSQYVSIFLSGSIKTKNNHLEKEKQNVKLLT